ncbi:MAG: mannitol-1-phosphate 5-dehydrogenase [Treponema sp.]|jgi:mannitol-1-phosphate 5-dehydrogenase|nr:mannitol-1-phosphate 5-dehydrogenase [Treponema sp.]
MKLVQIGAGSIGRSFVGALFSRAGWDVVFVDVDERLVSLLNGEGCYTVAIRREGKSDEYRRVGPVRAVNGTDIETAAGEIAGADITATSVGKAVLPRVIPLIAAGLEKRLKEDPRRPLDIIIAENARGAPGLFRAVLAEKLGPSYPLDDLAGLVETSIGKMVPLMRAEDLARDPLLLYAEEYETLIADKTAFRGPPPDVPGLFLAANINAFVDRKLFIHNLGHAAAAYLGYRTAPARSLLADVLPLVELVVRSVMEESARALETEYPEVFTGEALALHIDDLLFRFKNKALGDTVHRVGRDLPRKLSRDDRVTGAMLLSAKHGFPLDHTAEVYRAALSFAARDESGQLFPADEDFRRELLPRGTEAVLREISALDPAVRTDRAVMEAVLAEKPRPGEF